MKTPCLAIVGQSALSFVPEELSELETLGDGEAWLQRRQRCAPTHVDEREMLGIHGAQGPMGASYRCQGHQRRPVHVYRALELREGHREAGPGSLPRALGTGLGPQRAKLRIPGVQCRQYCYR